jgi:hypothetical protein
MPTPNEIAVLNWDNERPLGLAGRSTYFPDISPEELERHIEADTRKAILDEEDEQARITRLLR